MPKLLAFYLFAAAIAGSLLLARWMAVGGGRWFYALPGVALAATLLVLAHFWWKNLYDNRPR